jgi:hypothetical protein
LKLYDPTDSEFEDNVCISFTEDCPRMRRYSGRETNITDG